VIRGLWFTRIARATPKRSTATRRRSDNTLLVVKEQERVGIIHLRTHCGALSGFDTAGIKRRARLLLFECVRGAGLVDIDMLCILITIIRVQVIATLEFAEIKIFLDYHRC
jgi:hypothetical protein